LNKFSAVIVALLFVLSACSDDGGKGSDKPSVPLKSKAGWTPELIENLIACHPNPGAVCDCIIPVVTARYTPEQVREKSPYVASDMLSIKANCKDKLEQVSSPTMKEPQEIKVPSLKGENCETGEHTYNSLQHFCEGIQSESINNSCAADIRRELFKEVKCPGSFEKKP
jgi:hypothetical protein